MNELTGRLLHEYRLWRRDEGDLAPASEKNWSHLTTSSAPL